MKYDYLVLGSGLAALSFAALMSQRGKRILVLEAHEFPGGYGHTFTMADKYTFNAQLHYVWDCGDDQPVGQFLKALGIVDLISFDKFDSLAYERMRAPGLSLDIPYDYELLIDRLTDIFPQSAQTFSRFVRLVAATGQAMRGYGGAGRHAPFTKKSLNFLRLIRNVNSTLQEVFDHFNIPPEAQTLLALQWPCFMLPPRKVSFLAWVALVDGYHGGAYSASKSFEFFVDSLVEIIHQAGGDVIYNRKVVDFIFQDERCIGAISENTDTQLGKSEHFAETIVCNIDPKRAAEMIGMERFSKSVRKRLEYEYSPSNFIAYCAVEGLDLTEHGFGKSILYHTSNMDLNETYNDMYSLGNYEHPSFAISTPSLHASQHQSCPSGVQLLELVTVADYQRFHDLKRINRRAYRRKKQEILDSMLNVLEKEYVPNIREHLCYAVGGTPTTNERYCFSPRGNSYGSNLTPAHFGLNRLDEKSSINGLYFCNASAGFPGFVGAISTGMRLFKILKE